VDLPNDVPDFVLGSLPVSDAHLTRSPTAQTVSRGPLCDVDDATPSLLTEPTLIMGKSSEENTAGYRFIFAFEPSGALSFPAEVTMTQSSSFINLRMSAVAAIQCWGITPLASGSEPQERVTTHFFCRVFWITSLAIFPNIEEMLLAEMAIDPPSLAKMIWLFFATPYNLPTALEAVQVEWPPGVESEGSFLAPSA